MKIAFITEMGFKGKIPSNHPNMRTEFAWMHALDADHFGFYTLDEVKDYDHVFIIFPKGQINLSTVGVKLGTIPNPYSQLLAGDWLTKLKANNKNTYYVQEGPHWMFTELEIADQIHFYNMLTSVDAIFAHNQSDVFYYGGLVPGQRIARIPTLMIEESIKDLEWKPEEKAIIGGNFARWYGGFESYMIAQEFQVPIWGQTSHAKRDQEDQLIQHLPRVFWTEWMSQLSTFKYAVHLMPTVAAGTFALNCSYFGIPCIGNREVDTQSICQPELAIDISDVNEARRLARRLVEDQEFYKYCSESAKLNYDLFYKVSSWKNKMKEALKVLSEAK
jgi:hypothetical protein